MGIIILIIVVLLIGGGLYFYLNSQRTNIPKNNQQATNNQTPEIPKTEEKSTQEQGCLNSGGIVSTSSCCQIATDFPNTCLIGACGCSSANSHQVKTCDCGTDKCFDGIKCLSQSTEENIVGVKVGDWVKYTVNGAAGSESNPEISTKAEVIKISGSNVTVTLTHYYKDGTTSTETRTLDVSKELGSITSANLNVGDSRVSYGGNNEPITVSQILTKTYNGVSRKVVYFNYNNATYGQSLQAYYDQQTGFLLEDNISMFGMSVHDILDSTNLW